ncbi:MAG: leucine-rich repeat domain-containing protein [Prevotella sp.]|nr:leucine-rich repeat domain-containing protein [Prevotella sp.]
MNKRTLLLFVMLIIAYGRASAAAFYVGNISYSITTDGDVRVVGYKSGKPLGNVNIPSTVRHDGRTYNVTSIENQAFYGCKTIESVSIPGSVTTIGAGAFNWCSSLVSVSMAGGALRKISGHAFANSGIKTIVIPSSVTVMEGSVFAKCKQLTSVTLDSGLTAIPSDMCSGCSNLTSIQIPSNIRSIGDRAFQDCNLTAIEIPSGVVSIGCEVFKGNHNISKVISHIVAPKSLNPSNFEAEVYNKAVLYVPSGKQLAYRKLDGWCSFRTIIQKNK